MSPTCTNSHYDNHATFVPSINHNKDVALLSYVELYIKCNLILIEKGKTNCTTKREINLSFSLTFV